MHSSDIAKAVFTTTKFREGYSMPDVDDLVNDIRQSLADWEAGRPGGLTAEAVVQARFTPTKFRTGYDQDQVDQFLDHVATALAAHESAPRF